MFDEVTRIIAGIAVFVAVVMALTMLAVAVWDRMIEADDSGIEQFVIAMRYVDDPGVWCAVLVDEGRAVAVDCDWQEGLFVGSRIK